MRISALRSSPFYNLWAEHIECITVHGKEVRGVIEFDTDMGWALVHEYNPDGTLIYDSLLGEFKKKKIYGRVVIHMPNDVPVDWKSAQPARPSYYDHFYGNPKI